MKYNQPYGISDPNGPYINGDPSIGRAGSIPPAESIEFPQREIVNLISDVNLFAPDNADLRQLGKSIQSQKLWAVDDAGTANQYSVTLAPAPGTYFRYLLVVAWIVNPNTGPANLNVNAMGAKPIVRSDGSPLIPGDIGQNTLNAFMYDGAAFRMVWQGKSVGGPVFLDRNLTFYVNDATGSDNNDGAAAVVGGGHGPFKTLQKAANTVRFMNLNGYNITINVADSQNYRAVNLPACAGSGTVLWVGNVNTPANVLISENNTIAIAVSGVNNVMQGFKVQTTGVAGQQNNTCAGIHAQGTVQATFQNFEWGPTFGPQIFAYGGAYLRFGGPKRISGSAQSHAYGLGCFINCQQGGRVDCLEVSPPQPLTIVGAVNYAQAFIEAQQLSAVAFNYSTLTGAATGKKYDATYNSVINVAGGGANYLPGDVAGTVSNGGQYG
ncbi:hypothetical protein [Bradyrhizobium sp. BRP23]|uniref:hypothetical protein n=1 Tax=Bradyrhizobium sp. BRP23 TaxID=2793820 RepID=UPI001CD4AA86|nr:hypothetical protein [Bradyrhizobium sp. BRP23]MCA1419502.1 hypothetical protein [Bradyrhizobium sp. BRP23]